MRYWVSPPSPLYGNRLARKTTETNKVPFYPAGPGALNKR